MNQPPIDNRTEFVVHPQMLLDRDGEKLVTVVKATFELPYGDERVELAPPSRARKVRPGDLPWQKDKPESIAYPGDVCLRKPGTDVLVVGMARPPRGRPSPAFDARVEVGPVSKSVAVFGPRVFLSRGVGLSDPAPTEGVELRWDLAYGGRDDSDPDDIREESRNPVGRGVARDPDSLTHAPAPQIEDPAHLLHATRVSTPKPAGLGPIGRNFAPRRAFAGTYDKTWKNERAPLLPDDFDDRHNLAAAPDLVATPPLRGGEPVRLLNLTPGGGAIAFSLPRISLVIEMHVKGREPAVFAPFVDTVLLDTLITPREVPVVLEMIFRAHVPAPRRMKDASIVVREQGNS